MFTFTVSKNGFLNLSFQIGKLKSPVCILCVRLMDFTFATFFAKKYFYFFVLVENAIETGRISIEQFRDAIKDEKQNRSNELEETVL